MIIHAAPEPCWQPSRRQLLQSLTLAAAPALTTLGASAASRKRLLVTVSAGTGLDTAARRLSQALRDQAGIELDVENVPGGGGLLAVQRLLAAPADGNTLLLANSGLINTVPEMLQDGARFDPLADLVPLATVLKTPFVLFMSPRLEVRSLADLGGPAGRTLAPVSYGFGPLYGASHMAGHLLFKRLGLTARPVAYTQTSQLVLDLAAGRLTAGILAWSNGEALVANRQLQAVAALTRNRLPQAPDVPALAEHGLADSAHEGWAGVFHRPGVPPDALAPLAQALGKLLGPGPARVDLAGLGYLDFYKDAAATAAFVREDVVRHRMLLKDLRLP